MTGRLLRLALITLLLIGGVVACAEEGPPARDLDELVQEDSTYYAPETMEPYSGPVFRTFPDEPSKVQISAELKDGTWHDEMIIYHASGRLRYMGSFWEGERCGPWTENADSTPPASVFDELVNEIESMGVYPPCDPDR